MNKLFLMATLMIATISFSSVAQTASEEIPAFDANFLQLYPTSWHMLEDIFITQPLEAVDNSLSKRALMATLGLMSGAATVVLGKMGINKFFPQRSSYLQRKQNIVAGGAGLTAGLLTYTRLREHLFDVEEKRQLARLMHHWEIAREFLPNQLAKGLDELARLYKLKGPQYSQRCDEALRLIKNAIYEHFPQSYSKKKWSDFFSGKRLNIYVNIELLQVAEKVFGFVRRNIF